MTANLYAALPEIILALGSIFALMFCVYQNSARVAMSYSTKISSLVILASLLSTVIVTPVNGLYFNQLFIVDDFSVFVKILLIFSAALVLILTCSYLEEEDNKIGWEYPIVLVLSLLGMLIMVSSNNMLTLYMGLELQSLSLYILAASKREDKHASEAAIKYFILGALASGILLYGISLVYGYTGSTSLSKIAVVFTEGQTASNGVVVGLVLIAVGLCFKISAAPFHMWTPDVYEGVPTPVTAYFAIVPKLAAAALFVRVFGEAFVNISAQWQQILIIISLLSMMVGAFGGLKQNNIKRLLAYSSIGHMGYILMGVASSSIEGVQSLLTYFVVYIFNSLAIFAVVLSLRIRQGNDESGIENIDHLKGLAKTNPILAMMFALMMVSMIGLPFPPFAGFFGKFFVFGAAINSELYTLAVIGVLTSVVAAFYYLKIIKLIYLDKPADNVRVLKSNNPIFSFIIGICAIVSLVIFLYPSLILGASYIAASSIF
ncbi:MAG: NADH-quinone oxidoreductase subunit NuoN [Rickettsiales bacterium]